MGVWAEALNRKNILVNSNIFLIDQRTIHLEKGKTKRQILGFLIVKCNNIRELSRFVKKDLVARSNPFVDPAPAHEQKMEKRERWPVR
jgi:hypothetical protein